MALKAGPIMEVSSGDAMHSVNVDPPVLPWAERPWHIVLESVLAKCTHMLAAVREGRQADTAAADNLKTFALAEAAYEAARTGRSVQPAYT